MHEKLIKCGALYDGIHSRLEPNMEILIEGDRILQVGRSLAAEDAAVIDLSHLTITPGLIDAHIHTTFFDWHTVRQENLETPAWKALASLRCAQHTLHRGFTSIRDAGTGILTEGYHGFTTVTVRRVLQSGYFEGSRMKTAPLFLCTPGSHGDQSQPLANNPVLAKFLQQQNPTMGSGADFFRNAVREQAKFGADYIKIMATGGFYTPNDSPLDQQLSDEELLAIIQTAKEVGLSVTAHAYSDTLIQKLVKMGIDGIEHAAMISETTAELIEKHGVYVVPTLSPYDEVIHMNQEALAQKQPEFRRKLEQYREQLVHGREVLKKSNIRLGYGTDFVAVHQNYESGYEYAAWLNSGFDPFRALKAATSINAEIIGMPEVGIIAPGKLADLAGWKRNLLTDPQALLDCAFVMQGGKVFDAVSCLQQVKVN